MGEDNLPDLDVVLSILASVLAILAAIKFQDMLKFIKRRLEDILWPRRIKKFLESALVEQGAID